MSEHSLSQLVKILIVEDEIEIAKVLKEYLTSENFFVDIAADGEEGLEKIQSFHPDLILLDLQLPKISGIEVLRKIHSTSNVAIIVLTSRANEIDRIVGLELGADDYIGKPFSPREVVARVRTVLRRSISRPLHPAHNAVIKTKADRSDRRRVGDIEIDCLAHEVFVRGNQASLTPTEFRILNFLSQNLYRVFSRDQLIERFASQDGDILDRTLDRHIANIRRKIEPSAKKPSYIITVIGNGYKMVDPV